MYVGWAVLKQHALCFSRINYLSSEKVFVTAPAPKYQMIACFEANLSVYASVFPICAMFNIWIYVDSIFQASLEMLCFYKRYACQFL